MDMDTPDGIPHEEWDRVTDLAYEVVQHIVESEARRRELFEYLDVLEQKYGLLPSILATRADFVAPDEVMKKEELLVRAYALALDRHDRANALYIAHSLANMYLDGLAKPVEGERWLTCFQTHLYVDPEDEWWQKEYDRLKKIAMALRK
jgi:hypothetical protein